jgi:hypothetical protein
MFWQSVVTHFGSGENEQMPAPKAGGLYKTNCSQRGGFVEATPSRVLRDGVGTFPFKLSHCLAERLRFFLAFASRTFALFPIKDSRR